MLSISVLGPVEVRRGVQPVAVPAGKTSELLVRLAVDAGVLVRADRLVEDLWAIDAIHTRRNTLQSKIAKLRRALGDADVVVSTGGGYQLDIAQSDIDALAVLDHTAIATGLLEAGDARRAAELCTATLKMYRGDVLASAGDGDWVVPHRARLEEARMKLVETQFSARLVLGDVGDVVGELEAAIATYPYQESLWELLITSLYRAGRQADALATYQRVRNRLAEDLGLAPGPQLQLLEQQILVHDAALGSPHRSIRATGAGPSSGNLPSMAPQLVGREQEIAALFDLLADNRLVEVVGPGGIGKTAVAIETCRRISVSNAAPGGVWLARLETAATANDVIDTLVAAVNVTGGEAALFERLKGSGCLVILDNCEHIVDAAASLAVRLLDACHGLRLLCTSQVALDIDGETLFELMPLALSDAVELFTQRATVQRKGQSFDKAGDALSDLCLALDGLPLAIELAAARTKTLSIEEITRRLDDRFNVLSDPTSRRPERRRELKATIRWSYELLFPDDQRGLWALATFAGGAPLPAVEFVLAALDVPAAAAIDVVGRLASRSLVIVDDGDGDGDEGTSRHVRYRLLDSIRAYALEAMSAAGRTDQALAAHAAWFGEAARSHTKGVRSDRQADYLSIARTERANIDAALAWAATRDPLLALDIVNGFGWAWVVLGDSRGAQRILSALAAAKSAAPAGDRAGALLLAGWIEASTGHLEAARDHIEAAIELADSTHDIDLQARCCYYLAYVVSHEGEFRRALELTDRSSALYEGLDRPWDQAANWLFASRAAISAGDQERSIDAASQVQRWLQLVDDPWLQVRRDAMLGELARIQGRFGDAVVHIGRAAETSRRLGFLQTEAYQVSSLGRAQCQAGDYDSGAATLEIAIDKAEATGDVRMAALARVHLGRVLRALGHPDRARAALEAATAFHRAAGGGEQAALGDCLLAALDAADLVDGAKERLEVILGDARHNDEAHVEVFALDALARIATEAGDDSTARDLSGAANQRMAAAFHFITDRDRVDAHPFRQMA